MQMYPVLFGTPMPPLQRSTRSGKLVRDDWGVQRPKAKRTGRWSGTIPCFALKIAVHDGPKSFFTPEVTTVWISDFLSSPGRWVRRKTGFEHCTEAICWRLPLQSSWFTAQSPCGPYCLRGRLAVEMWSCDIHWWCDRLKTEIALNFHSPLLFLFVAKLVVHLNIWTSHVQKLHPGSLTTCPWKMVGKEDGSFPIGSR